MGLATARLGLTLRRGTRYAPELDAAVIARYDRQWVDGDLQRLHQNDLCQSLGIELGRKYELDGGPTLAMCCTAVMQHSSQPALDKKRMLEWAVFNVAVTTWTAHAKNLSLLSTGGHTRLAPFYDLICTTVYEHLSKRFAFKIGGEKPSGMDDGSALGSPSRRTGSQAAVAAAHHSAGHLLVHRAGVTQGHPRAACAGGTPREGLAMIDLRSTHHAVAQGR